MKPTGEIFNAIAAELDEAVRALAAVLAPDPSLWERGRPGKWTVGQHVAHVGVVMTQSAGAFEIAERDLRSGNLPPPPRRGLVQSLVVKMLADRGFMPRGAKAEPGILPPERPDAVATLDALSRDAKRHRVIGERLDAAERDRLWIANPVRPAWHFRLPEMVRVHAVHAQHHRKLIDEIARGR